MSKVKTVYRCEQCGADHPKWAGQCSECGEWNSLTEVKLEPTTAHRARPKIGGYAGQVANITTLNKVSVSHETRLPTGISEFDRVLGGGLVTGSVVLIGGDPGIGKSTILLQTATHMASAKSSALYITGEESLSQVALRAQRLDLPTDQLKVMAETCVERICEVLEQEKPVVAILDSIQTLYTETLQSAPGGVSQIRESAALLTRYAKNSGTALFIVGHVTKEGALAGPRVLEHMVDCVLYFEGQSDSRYRMIRAVKNRFGAVNELGVFGMTDKGLREVANPSAIFLSRYDEAIPGSIVMISREGTRPLLVEVQALVDDAQGQPRRVALGLEQNRLNMLLAVMHRHGGVQTTGQDVYVNIVGGLKITETGSDLAVLLACASSLRTKALPQQLAVFGEVGLSGEIRPVPNGQERLKEAAKHGFKYVILPRGNAPQKEIPGVQVIAVARLHEALTEAMQLSDELT
ncbi:MULTISPECIES: DNA repair protein RadA [Acinetobacter]|uniref:DNA repair protein RadA n=1 Tax=Acinetobacter TaxID=469 RepID=UPI00125047F2|nr:MULTISPECIES: DNA repair protein RadA [Acinetobacter]MCG8284101.1 DNA repair protein RadA [Acinetobacter seifertii]MCH2001649.1 DNA repair protein RadA [Acinetobacter seifertii]MDK4791776.1 DNA repair protein RadA [Acinetobacter sp.]MDS7966290.1 DNA repair protein RadA [Acinetobacter sp. V117_2]